MSERDVYSTQVGPQRGLPLEATTTRVAGSSSVSNPETKTLPPQIRFVPHVINYARSLHFDALDREVPAGLILKVGRYTDKVAPTLDRIAFKSKVVSRSHAEIWSEGGQFFLRDTKSSSGTFLNQQRLSPPNQESSPHLLKDGDILQLGVDYQGGTQDVFRCVKIRLEINRSWQKDQQNPFRQKALQTLEALKKSLRSGTGKLTGSDDLEECCICLCSIAAFQALFVAPCSHTFHYKCIRRLLLEGPSFVCPLCRTYADLESDVCVEDEVTSGIESMSISNPPEQAAPEETNSATHAEPSTLSAPPSVAVPSPNPENGELFPSEHQECRTPANPTPHLLFAGTTRSVAPTRSLSATLPSESESGNIRSPALGEVRN
ncbi:hypothetical protein DSO57_1031797 [Entomophthora muscae]|uniref:Uncharacterized protein n=1 Tax=Entomophthora muscae TaxID=34485 RepID=A0ACC2TYH6_9FUNG|nr:hypothetical protein DSO57_1031797 [Entomophthora muscae]